MKTIKLLVLAMSLVLYAGCETRKATSGSDDVDFIGTWNYKTTYHQTKCDHLTSKGTITIDTLKNNTSKIGQVTRKGDKIMVEEKYANGMIISFIYYQ